jgi:hypothetical protein
MLVVAFRPATRRESFAHVDTISMGYGEEPARTVWKLLKP